MNQRILQVRERNGLNQEEFAKRLGLTKSAISGYETGRRSPTEPVIKAICREFFIDEIWLRTGEGAMEQGDPADIFNYIDHEYHCTNFESAFIRSYFSLNDEERISLSNYLFKVFGIALKELKDNKENPYAPASSAPNNPIEFINNPGNNTDAETAELEEEYKKSRSDSASKTTLSASSTIEENEKKKNA